MCWPCKERASAREKSGKVVERARPARHGGDQISDLCPVICKPNFTVGHAREREGTRAHVYLSPGTFRGATKWGFARRIKLKRRPPRENAV